MKHRTMDPQTVIVVTLICGGLIALLNAGSARAEDKHPFNVKAEYVEGCSCSAPCTCQLTGIEPMCQGVNAVKFTGGQYQGTDLAGAKFAFATKPGAWVRLFVEAKNPKQREAVVAFAKAYSSGFGKIEEVKDAAVEIEGKNGKYTVQVDGGKTLKLVTEPILGGDNKTPLVYSNIHDTLHPTVKQGKTIKANYDDGKHSFELKDSNAYFNDKFETKGEM